MALFRPELEAVADVELFGAQGLDAVETVDQTLRDLTAEGATVFKKQDQIL